MAFKIVLRGLEKIKAALERERRRVDRAALRGVKEVTDDVKQRTRAVVRRAFRRRGFRVATIVRGDVKEYTPRRVIGTVRSAWVKRAGTPTAVDPIFARLFGGIIRPRAGGWLTIRGRRAPASVRVARETQKTYWVKVRPGVLVLIGRGKTGRARPRVLFTLVRQLVMRRRTTTQALLGNAARAMPERVRRHYRLGV